MINHVGRLLVFGKEYSLKKRIAHVAGGGKYDKET